MKTTTYALINKGLALAIIILMLLAYLVYQRYPISTSSVVIEKADTTTSSSTLQLNDLQPSFWSCFQGTTKPLPEDKHTINEKYRLAGTFITFGSNGRSGRTAIIDDLETGKQRLIAQQERLGKYLIATIERERVFLKAGAEELVLTLSFSNREQIKQESASAVASKPPTDTVISENRFGKRVAENRWVLSKDALQEYYNEMLDDPERIASIYISLKPDYDHDSKIKGYDLDMIGEQDFFGAIGLQQGDIIRKANSMNMTSQARGEYFLREFVNNRLGAVVLDIDRDHVRKKMIYLIR